MADLLKFLLPIFGPKNYSEMLKKLASFVFYEIWFVTFLLRSIPEIDTKFQSVESFGAIGKALSVIPAHEKLNLCGLAIALIVAGVSYAVQFHDRISDLLRIRQQFDRNYILFPLAVLVGAELSPAQINTMIQNRDAFLRTVFYPYVSSTAANPLVEKHEIERVMDIWSWYWVLVEAIPILLAASIVAGYFHANELIIGFGAAFIVLWLAAWLYSFRLERFTRPEIEAIAANATARLAVREAFDAL